MFGSVQPAPPDPILGLSAAFKQDPNPEKVNLGVGVYKDAAGRTPVLDAVKQAERRLIEQEDTKAYLPIEGDQAYGRLVRELMFGADHQAVHHGATAHTPGGTGALRVAADYLHAVHGRSPVWLSDPSWPNHKGIFQAAGLDVRTYPYFDPATNGIRFDEMLAALRDAPEHGVVVLHGCCHNPTGADPSLEQWCRIADVLAERGLLPLLDFAYQGFADGLDEDAAGLRAILERCPEALVCSSFSKNFGLYNERVGALTVVASDAERAQAVLSQVRTCIRRNYSNPPAHGGMVVKTILSDAILREAWLGELAAMRQRINAMRSLMAETLARKGAKRDFGFITRQRGMFSYSGLTREQVTTLRERFSIYAVGDGRINVAGLTEDNLDRVCDAIVSVL